MQSDINTIDVPRTSPTNGFEKYQTDCTISVSGSTISVAYNNAVVYSNSKRKVMTGSQSITIPSGKTGAYYIYLDDTFTLVYAKNPTDAQIGTVIQTYALVCIGYWNALGYWTVLTDERHGATKFGIDHLTEHLTIGAEYESGMDVVAVSVDGNGSSVSHVSVTLADGKQQDEDLRHNISGSIGIGHLYHAGDEWHRSSVSGNAVLPYTVSGVPQYVLADAVTPVPDNHYFVVYVYSVPTVASTGLPYFYSITGAETFANKNLAQAYARRAPQLTGLPSHEMLLCYSFLLQRKSSYTNGYESAIVSLDDGSAFYDWRKEVPASSGGGVVSKQWALFRSASSTAANATVPLVLRGQDVSNSFAVVNGVVDLPPNRTYVISVGLPNDSRAAAKQISINSSIDGGSTWDLLWGSGLSGVSNGTGVSGGTSVCDVYKPTVPTKLRLNAHANGSLAGVWLRLEVV